MSHPSEYTVVRVDRVHPTTLIEYDRFIIVDTDGDPVDGVEYATGAEAEKALHEMEENWEPPELGEAWDGGFAENH